MSTAQGWVDEFNECKKAREDARKSAKTIERSLTVDDFRNPPELADLIGRIDDMSPKLANELAKILCKHFKYHYGGYSSTGLVEDGKVEKCWGCWNCDWEVTQVTKVNR